MMKRGCKKTRKNLIAFLAQKLEEGTSREVAQHLAGCPLCSREADELASTWDLLGEYPLDEGFADITRAVIEKAVSADSRDTLIGNIIKRAARIPAPALCTFIAVLALPAGIYLGRNLHLGLSTPYAAHREKEVAAQPDELSLNIFSDFPDDSLGSIYVSLSSEG